MKKAQKQVVAENRSKATIGQILLQKQPELAAQMQAQNTQPEPVRLFRPTEFDSLFPEEKLNEFIAFLRSVVDTYDHDNESWQQTDEQTDEQTQDLLHYAELTENMNASSGFDLYKKLREIRRERRRCKNEMDLLKPLYDEIKATQIIDSLSRIKGKCRTAKEIISQRQYTMRTGVIGNGQ